ncbi:uncharacterized protein LMH87_008690 [Akanthomyces muscarius]|uniref:Uncharacterized protein n=1 Tax=Akanthomyces muscarius TaxID=2231603 RepID=A0A9W8UPW6_AKAMU|nr:uncharacterized protein LMH87_008690 [Akanthomyces muscarius]KAJ4158151.1 hypothetical protein LMH87_008690 [Akanthomyces muscarius]
MKTAGEPTGILSLPLELRRVIVLSVLRTASIPFAPPAQNRLKHFFLLFFLFRGRDPSHRDTALRNSGTVLL